MSPKVQKDKQQKDRVRLQVGCQYKSSEDELALTSINSQKERED